MTDATKTLSEIKREVFGFVSEELNKHAFIGGSEGMYRLRLDSAVWGSVGLNTALDRHDMTVAVSVFVGVRHDEVEKLVKRFTGARTMSLTISVPLYFLISATQYKEWVFGADEEQCRQEAAMMASSIEVYGIPFMRAHSALDQLRRDLDEDGLPTRRGDEFRIPIMDLISGNRDAAVARVSAELRKRERRVDIDANYYKSFASKFLGDLGLNASQKKEISLRRTTR